MKNRFAIPDSELPTLASAIKARRLELDISQEDLAEKANIHRTYVSLIERTAYNMTMKVFFKLAYVLELTPTELLERASSFEKPLIKTRTSKLSHVRLKQRMASFANRDI